jgi:hypothetical protein
MTRTGPRTIYLHIGTPKSGTTYLQSRLEANHEVAAAQGLLWPGPEWGLQVRAVDELRRLRKGDPLPQDGEWGRLVDALRAGPGDRAVVSMEWMASLTPYQIRTAMRTLDADRVEVICTVRDLLRSVVAHWQETTKNYRTWGWEQFVRELVGEEPRGRARQVFWRQQDVPAIIRRWSRHVPVERCHVITVPPPGADRDILWARFCSVVGLEGSDFRPPKDTNGSLGVVSSTLMHRVNVAAQRQDVEHSSYKSVLHRKLARDILAAHREQEAPITVDPGTESWVRKRADRLIRELGKSGVDLIGDVDELRPGATMRGRTPSEVSDGELLELCTEALVALGMRQRDEIAALTEENRRLRATIRRRGLPVRAGAFARRIAGRQESAVG